MHNLKLNGIEMLYTIFSKEVKKEVKEIHDEYTITYYIETHRKSISVIYEFIGLYKYDFRRYNVELAHELTHEGIIIGNIMKNFEKIYNGFNQRRKLAVVTKFVIYTISKQLNIPLYKLIRSITYEANGETIQLSPHSFANSVYNLIPEFEKILY